MGEEYYMQVCVKGSVCLSVCQFVSVLGVEPNSSSMLTKYSVTGTHPKPAGYFFKKVTHDPHTDVRATSAIGFI